MTTSKLPSQVPSLGQIPGASDRRPGLGAPLPMVTQPLMTSNVLPVDNGRQTIVSNPLASLEPRTAAALFGRQPGATMVQREERPRPAGPPPEIGLTEHVMPTDGATDRRLALMIDPDSERAASFRVLRHHLLEVGRPQCVVVSSPRSGDGKTTTAINLALALAECGRAKVLLVETHLRRPQLASAFKFVPQWCFAEQLAAHRHQPNMPWSFIDIPQLWLHVAAVNPRIEKTQLLDGPAFSIALDRLRLGGYDHIVIDAPPVLGSADVNLMADAADTVLMVVRSKVSTTRDLRKAIEQLGAAKVAGTVLVED
jgi:Mrp family chromosome partitioning ATPase